MLTDKNFDVAEEALDAYLQAWSDNDYEAAYELLTANSPLRLGLTRDAWVIRHRTWAEDAQPAKMRFEIVESELDAQELLPPSQGTQTATAQTADEPLEVFWSIEMSETPLTDALNDLPLATAVYKETRRHWFWATFTLAEVDGSWRVHSMNDAGAAARRMSVQALNDQMEKLSEVVKQLASEAGLSNIAEMSDEESTTSILEKLGEDISFEDILEQAEEVRWISIRGMHYSDALIAQEPDNELVYDLAVSQATAIDEWERAASYLELIIARFPAPETCGQAMRLLSIALSRLIAEVDEESGEHYGELVEKMLRAAIETDHHPQSYIMLADLFLNREQNLKEVQSLLQEAKSRATESEDIASAEYSLGRLAETEDKLEEARLHYERAVELDGTQPGLWASLGYVQHALGQTAKAIESYKHAIETEVEDEDPYVELASIYIEEQKPADAAAVLEQGLMFFPESANLYATFTIVALQSGDMTTAEEYLDMAEEIDPESDIVRDARLVLDTLKAQQKSNKSKSKNKPKHKKR